MSCGQAQRVERSTVEEVRLPPDPYCHHRSWALREIWGLPAAEIAPRGEKNHYLSMSLNKREIAILVWSILGIGYFIWQTRSKESLSQLIGVFFSKPIMVVLGLMIAYVTACIWFISLFGWWDWSNLKTTVIWAGGSAFVALFNFQKIETEKSYFSRAFWSTVSINTVVAFIASTDTFSIPVELVISLALIIFAIVAAVSERDQSLAQANVFAKAVLAILGLVMFGNSVYYIVTSLGEFATSHTAREFVSPILLTCLFFPFLYAIHAYSIYDRVISSFKYKLKNQDLVRYAVSKLVREMRFDLTGWEQWRRHAGMFELTTRSDVDNSINEIRNLRRREKRPHRVRPVFGWLPNHAIAFLESRKLPTNNYHRTHDCWSACSRYLDIGDELLPSNIAYYIEGDEYVVKQLKLVLNVNAPGSVEQAYEQFFQIVAALVKAALPSALHNGQELSISSNEPPIVVNGHEIKLVRTDWPAGIKGGYDLAFTIKMTAPSR